MNAALTIFDHYVYVGNRSDGSNLPESAQVMPVRQQKRQILQAGYENGSDGTRTRDLRRDKPLRGREVNTKGTGSLCTCGPSALQEAASHG